MNAKSRQNEIIQYMEDNGGSARIIELALHFGVSSETIRRDVEILRDARRLQRVSGGAILIESLGAEAEQQKAPGHKARAAIGAAAAELIQDGQTLLISSGYTCLEVAKALKAKKKLTIVTNSFTVASSLVETDFEIIVLGGQLDHDEMDTSGSAGFNALQSIFADWTIIGAGGVTFEYGISDYNTGDSAIRTEMMRRCNNLMLVAEGNKFGRNAFRIRNPINCGLSTIISDSSMSQEYVDGIKKMGIDLILT